MTWDHPRSRGVYRRLPWPRRPPCGSSPLARGLPVRIEVVESPLRIIPARAGFTPTSRSARPWPGDHPRSRGVYTAASQIAAALAGSSPLARGLLRVGTQHGARPGIIPARAGFTAAACVRLRRSGDHPRSRGVYPGCACPIRGRGGSSPLARGLLLGLPRLPRSRRIIPARAGFTAAVRPGRPAHEDHPRSRGVYLLPVEDFRHRVGSSPLARGLRVRRPASGRQGGIIPARAGFTGIERTLYGESADHPRSRGVYPPSTSPPSNGRGSSPLARGLQEDRARQGDDDGIIPARAGFTRRAAARSRPEPDHPRSRGVYREPIRDGGIPLGSSPLARGLHIMVRGKAFYARIIPARAGFTRPVRSSSTRSSDHPRSRGVYPATVDASSRPPGSSPLARGLRLRQTEHLVEIGIIPARAGFTGR